MDNPITLSISQSGTTITYGVDVDSSLVSSSDITNRIYRFRLAYSENTSASIANYTNIANRNITSSGVTNYSYSASTTNSGKFAIILEYNSSTSPTSANWSRINYKTIDFTGSVYASFGSFADHSTRGLATVTITMGNAVLSDIRTTSSTPGSLYDYTYMFKVTLAETGGGSKVYRDYITDITNTYTFGNSNTSSGGWYNQGTVTVVVYKKGYESSPIAYTGTNTWTFTNTAIQDIN